MNIFIPCGGIGERFAKEGYQDPKPLVAAMGKPIILWLLQGLVVGPDDVVVLAYHKELEKWRMQDRLRKALPAIADRLRVVHLTRPTLGAAETVSLALQSGLTPAELERKTMVVDCDTCYRCNVVDAFRAWEPGLHMSVVFRDEGASPIYSYCQLDDAQNIQRIAEKERISPWANSGCYCFASGDTLLAHCELTLADESKKMRGEFYMSSVIASMLETGEPFRALTISNRDVVCLGTPLQLRLFCASGPSFAPRRVCFDLDGTLITHPRVPGDYDTVEPYTATIEYARYLKSLGNTIIVQTARGMRSSGGNPGSVHARAAKAVYDALERFEIPCDELFFLKPHADIYIDDLAHNVCNDLPKATGFYQTSVSERKHNVIEGSLLRTIVKRSEVPLDGEIHWYKHAPACIRHLFPAFIRSDPGNSWYEIEHLESTSCSYLYVNECLTRDQLLDILARLGEIHGSMVVVEDPSAPSIYANYASKLESRYESYDYSRFPSSKEVYGTLLDHLTKYEASDLGRPCVIHGDPVLSNVLLARGSGVRFVDMRGKQGDVCTIVGDMWYDYAKLYQSLVGYDEILLDHVVSQSYRTNMLDVFRDHVVHSHGPEAMNIIQTIAASLFFTLIPLHDNDRCAMYMEKCMELLK
jgi:dTDP-glucose pyrophosphorylase